VKIENAKLDDEVELYLNSDGSLSRWPTSLVHTGTVIMHLPPPYSFTLVAWKDRASATLGSNDMHWFKNTIAILLTNGSLQAAGWKVSGKFADYHWGEFILNGVEVGTPASAPPVPPVPSTQPSLSYEERPTTKLAAVKFGNNCSRCHSFNEYVESDKPYTCYSCKH
jgi:hypothetical protein